MTTRKRSTKKVSGEDYFELTEQEMLRYQLAQETVTRIELQLQVLENQRQQAQQALSQIGREIQKKYGKKGFVLGAVDPQTRRGTYIPANEAPEQ